jgi:membrane-associated phospholipid phosphatase
MRTSPHEQSVRTIVEIDKVLALAFLSLLVVLGIAQGQPIFDSIGDSRLTLFTIVLLPPFLLLAIHRSNSALRDLAGDWWPLVCTLAVYESLKHLHANRITEWLGVTPKDELMLRIDELLFGRALPLWIDHWSAPWFQTLMWWCYFGVYFLMPIVMLGWAYAFQSKALYRRLRVGLVLCLLGGYVMYLLVPVAGPVFLVGDQFKHPISNHPGLERIFFDTLRYHWDCFPSLHTAIPWLLTTLAWGALNWPARALCAALASVVTLSTIALRFHYGIDLIAAIVWVGLVHAAVNALATADYGRIGQSPGER